MGSPDWFDPMNEPHWMICPDAGPTFVPQRQPLTAKPWNAIFFGGKAIGDLRCSPDPVATAICLG